MRDRRIIFYAPKRLFPIVLLCSLVLTQLYILALMTCDCGCDCVCVRESVCMRMCCFFIWRDYEALARLAKVLYQI